MDVPRQTGDAEQGDASRSGFLRRNGARLGAVARGIARDRRERGLVAALGAARDAALAHAGVRAAWLRERLPGTSAPGAPPRWFRRRPGVLFVGYLEASLGLGQSLRSLVRAVSDTGVPFAILPVTLGVETRFTAPFMRDRADRAHRFAVTVIEVAADQLPAVVEAIGPARLRGAHTILRTYWELPAAPAAWAPHLARVDEIWAPTRFVAEAFRPIFAGPITIVPPCVDTGEADIDAACRADFGMEAGRFYFLFSFDYYSTPARKNPLGVLDAFRAAFPRDDRTVGLVVKSTSAADHHPDIKAALAAAAADERIVVIDRVLTRAGMLSLIAAADCYVSLHRSEGFGLGMAEAMSLRRPVIGTDFSGSRDFLSAETGFPVACRLRPVRPDEYIETEGQVWAEPDPDDAVAAMRRVRSDPLAREARAAAAAAFVARRHGPRAVGQIAAERLAALLAARKPRARRARHARS